MEKIKKEFPSRKKGIISIVFAFLMPLIGLILGIYAIVNSKKNLKVDKTDEEAQSGFILGIVGTSISIIIIAFYLGMALLLPDGKSEYVTYENFEQISLGSSYENVKGILGHGKEENASYIWFDKKNKNTMNSITIYLDENKSIIKKKMIGNAKDSALADEDMRIWVKKGMTLEEIEMKVGRGTIIEAEIIDEGLYTTFSWHSIQGRSYHELHFVNDVLLEIDSGGLE